MAGSIEGGKLAAKKNKASDPDYYRKIALLAHKSYMSKPKEERKPRGFAANPELASRVGAVGGRISRRKGKK